MDDRHNRVVLVSKSTRVITQEDMVELLLKEFPYVKVNPAFDANRDDELFAKISKDSRWESSPQVHIQLKNLREMRSSSFVALIGPSSSKTMVLNVLSSAIVVYGFDGQESILFESEVGKLCRLLDLAPSKNR